MAVPPPHIQKETQLADFMYLFRGGDEPAPGEMDARMAKWKAWMGPLTESGQLVGGAPLDDDAVVLRGVDKTESAGTVGGPDDEVGGYLIVTCKDRDEAVELARGCPIFEVNGALEIRALIEM